MTIDAILFDKDGTLLDFTPTWLPAYQAGVEFASGGNAEQARIMMAETGYDEQSNSFRPGSLLASGTTDEIVDVWSKFGVVQSATELVISLDHIFEQATAKSATPFSGLSELISHLNQKVQHLGVVTNDSENGAHGFLKHADIDSHFSFVAGYDSGHGRKPGTGMMDAFCETHDIAPEAVMVVGDNHCDLEMARSAKAGSVVGVLSGVGTRAELEPLADILLEDINGLLEYDFS